MRRGAEGVAAATEKVFFSTSHGEDDEQAIREAY
jgi:hypothetical protein